MDYVLEQYNDKLKELLRFWLADIYQDKNVSEEKVMKHLRKQFNMMRKHEPGIYKSLMGMIFSDTYRNIAYELDYGYIRPDTKENWNKLNEVVDITDLISRVDSKDISFDYLIDGYITFQGRNSFEQFLGYELTDIKHLLKFSPHSIFSYLDLIKMYSLTEAIEDYAAQLNEDEEFEEEETTGIDGIIKKLKNKLLILSVHDNREFKRMMIEIITNYYRIAKSEQETGFAESTELDELLILMIEEKEVEEIIENLLHSEILLAYVINKYLNYEAMGYEVEELDSFDTFQTTMEKIKSYALSIDDNHRN